MRALILAATLLTPVAAWAQTAPGSVGGTSFTRCGEPVMVQAGPTAAFTQLPGGKLPTCADGSRPTTYVVNNYSAYKVRYSGNNVDVTTTTGNVAAPFTWHTQTTINPTQISAMTVPTTMFPTPGNTTLEFVYGQGDGGEGSFQQLVNLGPGNNFVQDSAAEASLATIAGAIASIATTGRQDTMIAALQAIQASSGTGATAAKQDAQTTALQAIQAAGATAAAQATGNTSLANILAKLGATVAVTQGTMPWTTARTPPPGTLKSCAGTTSATAGTSTALLAAGNWTRGFHGYVVGASGIRISFLAAAGTTLTDTNSFVLFQGYTFSNPDWMPAGTPITVSSTGQSQAVFCEYN